MSIHQLNAARFDRENPEVYTMFKHFTMQALKAGMKRLSVALVIERIRWETAVVSLDADGYKINNNHTAYYARKFMSEYPELGEVF